MPSAKTTEVSQAEIELKRRGRRRLIGAVTLGLIAIVVLPMIFDSEPKKQLANKQEISIAIPPKEGLPPLSAPVAPPPASAVTPSPSPPSPVTPSPQTSTPAKPDATPAPAKVAPTPAPAIPPVAQVAPAKVEPKTEPKAEPKAPTKVEPKAEPKTEPKTAAAKTGFVIQLGAFKDAENAKGIVKQMKDAKLPVFTDTIAVKTGQVTRVRVGPYDSKAKAEGALAEVKLAGGDGKVVPLQ
jgi:DedD protein